MKKSVVLLSILSLSISCSKIKEVENNMNNLKETTTEMKNNSEVRNQQATSAEAQDTRNEQFKILNSKDEDFGAKMAAADVYFKSLEFQFLSVKESDQGQAREVLLLKAANEFTTKITDIFNKINVKKMSPINEGKRQSEEKAFYALASTMHVNSQIQEDFIEKKAGIKSISFYDAIKSALKKDDMNDSMKEYEEVLVSGMNKEIMIELIKARIDILSALALKNLTDKRDMTLGQKLKAGLFKITGGKYGAIDLPELYTKSNGPTKKQTIKYLDAATKAKRFLSSINVEKELEKTLKAAFSKIKLGDSEEDPSEEGAFIEEQESQGEADSRKMEIKNLINGLLE
jgi:hypothetical protein